MPRGNGTGPMGMGPMSGRGMGYCADVAPTGGFSGMGMRGGRRNGALGFSGWVGGNGNGWNGGAAQVSDFSEKELLQRREGILASELKRVKARLGALTPKVDDGQS